MDRNFHKTALRMMSCFWIVALVISLLPHGAAAKQVPAGTFIRNVAQTTYFNEALGIIETVYSNAVDAKVAPLVRVPVPKHGSCVGSVIHRSIHCPAILVPPQRTHEGVRGP